MLSYVMHPSIGLKSCYDNITLILNNTMTMLCSVDYASY